MLFGVCSALLDKFTAGTDKNLLNKLLEWNYETLSSRNKPSLLHAENCLKSLGFGKYTNLIGISTLYIWAKAKNLIFISINFVGTKVNDSHASH